MKDDLKKEEEKKDNLKKSTLPLYSSLFLYLPLSPSTFHFLVQYLALPSSPLLCLALYYWSRLKPNWVLGMPKFLPSCCCCLLSPTITAGF